VRGGPHDTVIAVFTGCLIPSLTPAFAMGKLTIVVVVVQGAPPYSSLLIFNT
jgi:hypothetical protein